MSKYKQVELTQDQRAELKLRATECGLQNRGYERCIACGMWVGPRDTAEYCTTRPASQGKCPYTSVYKEPSKIKIFEQDS